MLTFTEVESDFDIQELFDKKLPCEVKYEHNDEAQWILVVRCSECGKAKRLLVCDECKSMMSVFIPVVRTFMFFSNIRACGHKVRRQSYTWVKL